MSQTTDVNLPDLQTTAPETPDQPQEQETQRRPTSKPSRRNVNVSAVLGKATMEVSHLLKLGRGTVVELDRKIGEAIDIYVNDRLVARGEVVLVEDRLGITMTEIVKGDRS
jgi:flagellar motor switch protein FliN/FliY